MATKKSKTTDLTVELLKQIRDDMRGMRAELSGVREELKATNARFDDLNRLRVESEVRIATALTALAGDVHGVRAAIEESAKLEKLELRVRALEEKAS